MSDEQRDEVLFLKVITEMYTILDGINYLKGTPAVDPRALAVAATYLETSMLWVANAQKDPPNTEKT